ncbi:MAG TPA: DUF1801 domain-containing protein, partial [Candidatus Sulfotelmatobacter sp.]|nr:DUF1801 domain-containing protein [Candidatus Sulfotelmatobacter sp.]
MSGPTEAAARVQAILAAAPPAHRALLEDLRATIAATAPEAEEAVSYGMAGFRYHGRGLASYASFKAH